ncbi:transcriptional regulator [Cohnella xylanilytica]|uniref:LysR family transcriptional regulator n=1 Tax=Cohnella xylanilytica TaxID=557555 RepID=A0A841TZU3_9BACL|nr:LysR family transcriptional regulator [Cohnella xylanilytica]MBB6693745.1 LysR family transcriptional regulator [Cohnella xylanilytica]GIO15035.1 transcriptional regulator [Cohnella xylanilytica]
MNLEQLECVVEVAKTGTLTGAARNLHITLSAVSQSISALETELGVVLFKRSRTGSEPTPEGQRIVRLAFEIAGKVQELRNEAAGLSRDQAGELKLATIPGPLSLAVDAVIGFKKEYPRISVEIVETGTAEIEDDIRHNRADIGLTVLHEEKSPSRGLVFGKLMDAKMVVAVSRQSPLAHGKTVKPQELAGLPLVLYKDETVKAYMERICAAYGPIAVLFSTNNTEAIRKSVKEGIAGTVGLDFSFAGLQAYMREEIVTLPLELPDPEPIYLGWLRSEEKAFSNAARLFIGKLKDALEALRPPI